MTSEQRDRINSMETDIVSALGYEGAFNALSKALGYDKLEEMYDYIIRVYGIQEGMQEELYNIDELAHMLADYFRNNPRDAYSLDEIIAYFDYKGISDLSVDNANEIWEYALENNVI